MKINIFLKLFSAVIFITVLIILYILFPNSIVNDLNFLISSAAFAFSIAYLFNLPNISSKKTTETAKLGSIGISAFLSLVLVFVALIGLILNIMSVPLWSTIMNVIFFSTFVLNLIIVGSTVTLLDDVSKKIDFQSAHINWARELRHISFVAKNDELAKMIGFLAEDASYLDRGSSEIATEIHREINNEISKLRGFAEDGSKENVTEQIRKIKGLFEMNNQQLRKEKSKL